MQLFKAKSVDYEEIKSASESFTAYSYIRDDFGGKTMFCVSPCHGRSFVICQKENGRWVVSKGNGLSYTGHSFINTYEMGMESWGLLVEKFAVRDFTNCINIQAKGIKTNQMEFVLKLNEPLRVGEKIIYPFLLQYNVECPYRICDFSFMDKAQISIELEKWESLNTDKFKEKYLIAADVLFKNLRIMHDNNILHNAIHIQNYTWALELLDFESSRTPNFPYNEEDEKRFPILYHRELIHTYDVINYIAWCLRENIDYKKIDNVFAKYGFNFDRYKTRSVEFAIL
ncbi:MAG: hypothetical protein FWF09_06160 [Bacteroidales bacterium]|nr:hypothetical protein [Bacteroidales bacterium]